jgi:hypothetical protein
MPAAAVSKSWTVEKTSTFLLPFCDCSFASEFAGTSGASSPVLIVNSLFKAFLLLSLRLLLFSR